MTDKPIPSPSAATNPPLVKYLLTACYTSHSEALYVDGAIVEIDAPTISWALSVMGGFEPLNDQLIQNSKMEGIPPLNELVFTDNIMWLESGSLERHLSEEVHDRVEPLDLGTELDRGYKNLVVVETPSKRSYERKGHHPSPTASGVEVFPVKSWFDLIDHDQEDAVFKSTRLHMTQDFIYWTSWYELRDQSVRVETMCLYKSQLQEMLEQLNEGRGMEPGKVKKQPKEEKKT